MLKYILSEFLNDSTHLQETTMQSGSSAYNKTMLSYTFMFPTFNAVGAIVVFMLLPPSMLYTVGMIMIVLFTVSTSALVLGVKMSQVHERHCSQVRSRR